MNAYNEPEATDVGIVIPTLGTRLDYLKLCIDSILNVGFPVNIVIVAPANCHEQVALVGGAGVSKYLADPGTGAAGAINFGFKAFPEHIRYVAWLGDDDLLESGSIGIAREKLERNPNTVAVFGNIKIIDSLGRAFTVFETSRHAVKQIYWGPNKIPQPGSLFRRTAVDLIAGLDESFRFAFDGDLFMRLAKTGNIEHVDRYVASFRWHSESLSSGQSAKSIKEASRARVKNLPRGLRLIAWLWETLHVGLAVARGHNSFDRALNR